ncbi:MAG: MFS transporter [Eubacterium sp.]|nr:MFS transporter [Eubacterium sp.]
MEEKKSKSRWLILLLLLASFAVTFMTRFVWSPVSKTVMGELGMSNVAAGSFMSAFFIGYVITQIPGGTLADRIGVKITMSAGLAISGLATICMSLIQSYSAGLALRVLTGLGAGVVMSCCTKVISESFEQKDRGIAFGVLLVGPTLGLTLANKLGAAILTSYGWRAAFRVIGCIAIIIAVLVFLFIRNTRAQNGVKPNLLTGIKIVFSTRNLICVCFGGFFYMFLNLGVSTWANTYLNNLGMSANQAANVMTIYSIGGVIGSLLTGFIVKALHLGMKKYLIAVYVLISIFTILFGNTTGTAALCVIGFIYGFLTYLPNAQLNALVTKYSPSGLSASTMGVQNCVFQMASILSPMIVGGIVDATGAFRACWITLAVVNLVGVIFWTRLKED